PGVRRRGPDPGIGKRKDAVGRGMAHGPSAAQRTARGVPAAVALADVRLPLREDLREHAGHRRAETPREALGDVLLLGEVEDGLGLDARARDVVDAAEAVRESELDALVAGPQKAREDVGRLLQALAAALADHVDELLVDVVQHRERVALLLLVDRSERVEERLVLA